MFLEPCVPGTLSSWNPRFRNLGATHSVYWNPGFPEPRRADLLSRCPPPCQRLLVDRALLVLEPWFPCKLVFWDPVRSMNLGTTHGVYPTPGLFPEPRNLARTLTLSLSGTCGIIQEVYPNCGSASVVVLGTLSKAKCARNLPGTLTSRNPKGSQNPLFPEPCLKVWFAEPWVPGTLPRTLVPGTLGSRNLAPNPGSRNRCSEPWFPEPAKRGGRVEQCPGAPRRLCGLRPQSILLLGKKIVNR